MQETVQLLVNGLIYGSILALGGLGISMLLGVLKIANFAHGDMMTTGAYLAFAANTVMGLSIVLSMAVAVVGTVLLCLLLEWLIWQRLRRTGAGFVRLLLSAFGTALVIRSGIYLFAGGDPRMLNINVFDVYIVQGIRISRTQVIALVSALLVVSIMAWVIGHTEFGRLLRAMSQNRDLALLAGVKVGRLTKYTWVFAGGLVAIAGVLQASVQSSFTPEMGWNLVLALFAAAVVGGVGSAYGALLGGLLVGVVVEMSTISIGGHHLPFEYKPVIMFGVLLSVLWLRPTGLLGEAARA
jgi:branched-subunit amino acid ABC-type transport system permease component